MARSELRTIFISPTAAAIGLGVMVLYWITLSILSSALTGIYRTGLYLYAREGKLSQGFGESVVQSAFAGKGKAGQWAANRV